MFGRSVWRTGVVWLIGVIGVVVWRSSGALLLIAFAFAPPSFCFSKVAARWTSIFIVARPIVSRSATLACSNWPRTSAWGHVFKPICLAWGGWGPHGFARFSWGSGGRCPERRPARIDVSFTIAVWVWIRAAGWGFGERRPMRFFTRSTIWGPTFTIILWRHSLVIIELTSTVFLLFSLAILAITLCFIFGCIIALLSFSPGIWSTMGSYGRSMAWITSIRAIWWGSQLFFTGVMPWSCTYSPTSTEFWVSLQAFLSTPPFPIIALLSLTLRALSSSSVTFHSYSLSYYLCCCIDFWVNWWLSVEPSHHTIPNYPPFHWPLLSYSYFFWPFLPTLLTGRYLPIFIRSWS